MIDRILSFFKKLNSGYYTYLLFFLLVIFAFRPSTQGVWYFLIWNLFFALTILSAIYNAKHPRSVKIAAIILAIPVMLVSWSEFVEVSRPFFIFNMMCTILFLGICTASILRDVVLYARVTVETLRGVVCAYFMIAFFFSYVYFLLEYVMPGSFQMSGIAGGLGPGSHNPYVMMYFSFVTLLTIGFGDITPLRDVSQTFVIMEGIIGQFYIAILVARIVSVYAFFADKELLAKLVDRTRRRKKKT